MTISMEDYIAFNAFHFERSDVMQRLYWSISIITSMVCFAILCLISPDDSRPLAIGLWVLMSFIWFLIRWHRRGRFGNRFLKYALRNGQADEFIGDRTLHFGESGIIEEGNQQTSEIAYGRLLRFADDEQRFYLYIGSMSAFIIPKRAFDSQEQMDELIVFLEQHAPQMKTELSGLPLS